MVFNWFKRKKPPKDKLPKDELPKDESQKDEPPKVELPKVESPKDELRNLSESAVEKQVETTLPTSEPSGLMARLRKGLAKTRKILTTDIDKLFTGKQHVDDDLLENLEELLITADIGVQISTELMEKISQKSLEISRPDQLKEALKEELLTYLKTPAPVRKTPASKPHVIMVLGVNGVGKTTTIGKLAARSVAEGKKVLIAAADTFRAAAVEQLSIWSDRAGAEIVKHRDHADPAAVAFDCVEAAMARGADLVLIDTAGRLHTRVNLMEELKKIKRTISKKLPDAPHEILLVLDATTGQNALSQVKLFNDALGVTGIALTKLDGTAKGGIVVSICSAFQIPLKYIGVGEQIEDLQDFNPVQFVDALF